MQTNKEIGDEGEALAINLLLKKEYVILHKNWRNSRYELDIVCIINNILVFVEVRTRSSYFFGAPENTIYAQKKKFIAKGAQAYLDKHPHDGEVRFDVISIVKANGKIDIHHFEDAFIPGNIF